MLSGLCHVWYLLRLSRRLHGCFEIKFASRRLSRSDSDLADSVVFYESGARGQEIAAAGGKKEKPRRRTALYKKPRKTAAIYAKAQKASRTLLGSGAGAAVAWDCPLRASVRHGRVYFGAGGTVTPDGVNSSEVARAAMHERIYEYLATPIPTRRGDKQERQTLQLCPRTTVCD